jgi:hypothetical protein
MTAYVANPPMKSAVLFGWEDRNGLFPVYFKGQSLLSTENSDACLKQTLDQVSMKQKTSTGSRGNWTTMTNVS